MEEIAKAYFKGDDDSKTLTEAITGACRGIYRVLTNMGTWGLSAISKLPTSGLDFSKMTEEQKRAVNNLPAMLYHGVRTEAGILMRMNSVPRSIAESIASEFSQAISEKTGQPTVREAREFLRALSVGDWSRLAPARAKMTGSDYRAVWARLSGESTK